jgi:glucokinase
MTKLSLLLLISSLSSPEFTPDICKHVENIPRDTECILAADIGGTKSDIGIFQVIDNKPQLIISLYTETKSIHDFSETIKDILAYAYNTYGIRVHHACIAAPGVTTKTRNYSNVHGLFEIHAEELREKTSLHTALVVNDLFVVGYGLAAVDPAHIIHLCGKIPDERNPTAIRAIVSIGTGVGSSLVSWDTKRECYIAHPGEAGMLEFSPSTKQEYEFANHIKNLYGREATYWANIASGSGIMRLYSMLKLTNTYTDSLRIDDHAACTILSNPEDELCKETINLFMKFLGRFIRNYVWAVLPEGGLYMIGGVINKSYELIAEQFAAHYENSQYVEGIKHIPIYIVKDSHIGLYGAAYYLISDLLSFSNSSLL